MVTEVMTLCKLQICINDQLTCMNLKTVAMHDHGLLAMYRQISHNYSESFAQPCPHYNRATSSSMPHVCTRTNNIHLNAS